MNERRGNIHHPGQQEVKKFPFSSYETAVTQLLDFRALTSDSGLGSSQTAHEIFTLVTEAIQATLIIQKEKAPDKPALEQLICTHKNIIDVYAAGVTAILSLDWTEWHGPHREITAGLIQGFVEHTREIVELQAQLNPQESTEA